MLLLFCFVVSTLKPLSLASSTDSCKLKWTVSINRVNEIHFKTYSMLKVSCMRLFLCWSAFTGFELGFLSLCCELALHCCALKWLYIYSKTTQIQNDWCFISYSRSQLPVLHVSNLLLFNIIHCDCFSLLPPFLLSSYHGLSGCYTAASDWLTAGEQLHVWPIHFHQANTFILLVSRGDKNDNKLQLYVVNYTVKHTVISVKLWFICLVVLLWWLLFHVRGVVFFSLFLAFSLMWIHLTGMISFHICRWFGNLRVQ